MWSTCSLSYASYFVEVYMFYVSFENNKARNTVSMWCRRGKGATSKFELFEGRSPKIYSRTWSSSYSYQVSENKMLENIEVLRSVTE